MQSCVGDGVRVDGGGPAPQGTGDGRKKRNTSILRETRTRPQATRALSSAGYRSASSARRPSALLPYLAKGVAGVLGGGASRAAVDAAALLRGALHNSTALCDAVLACLHVPDVDTQDKAVRALEQMIEAGLMAAEPAAQPDSCAQGVRTALRAFGTTCAAAGDDGCGDEDLLPLVRQLEGRLAPDS